MPHTPSPWQVIPTSSGDWQADILACPPTDPEGTLVASVYCVGDTEGAANARLISYAPDLLAAVKLLLALPGISSFAADLDSTAVKQAAAIARKAGGG